MIRTKVTAQLSEIIGRVLDEF